MNADTKSLNRLVAIAAERGMVDLHDGRTVKIVGVECKAGRGRPVFTGRARIESADGYRRTINVSEIREPE